MGLFGRTSCNEQRDWQVEAMMNDGDYFKLTEQLNEDEAMEFYEDLMEEVENSESGFIEVEKDRGNRSSITMSINLINVQAFRVRRY